MSMNFGSKETPAESDAVMRVAMLLERRVLMSMTPLAPLAP